HLAPLISYYRARPELPSFPTRRSSDLVSEAEAVQRLSRSPHWVWAAMDPESKLLLALNMGDRALAMAQRVVHQVVQVLAPGCVRSEEHTSELQSRGHLVCRLLLEKKKE